MAVLPLFFASVTYVAIGVAGFSLFYNAFDHETNRARIESAYWFVFTLHLILPFIAFALSARHLKQSARPAIVVLVLIMLLGTMFTLLATTAANSCVYKLYGMPLPAGAGCG